MPVSNGSGNDVEYDVPETDPPPGGGHLIADRTAMALSAGATGVGTLFMVLGCLPAIGNLVLTMVGLLFLGGAFGIQVTTLITGRRRARRRRMSGRRPLKACSTVPYAFSPGDQVFFYWPATGEELCHSGKVSSSDTVVELIEIAAARVAGGPSTNVAVIHDEPEL